VAHIWLVRQRTGSNLGRVRTGGGLRLAVFETWDAAIRKNHWLPTRRAR